MHLRNRFDDAKIHRLAVNVRTFSSWIRMHLLARISKPTSNQIFNWVRFYKAEIGATETPFIFLLFHTFFRWASSISLVFNMFPMYGGQWTRKWEKRLVRRCYLQGKTGYQSIHVILHTARLHGKGNHRTKLLCNVCDSMKAIIFCSLIFAIFFNGSKHFFASIKYKTWKIITNNF